MLTLDMLKVAHGDALWIVYGPETAPHRILVDGGPYSTYETLKARITDLPETQRSFELLVITHVDADHIDGIICLLQDKELKVQFDDIWFNGRQHLVPKDQLGGLQGEFLEALLETRHLPWNRAFNGNAVVVPEHEPLPCIKLKGGASLTLLSPTPVGLAKLAKEWDATLRDVGFVPGDRASVLKALENRKEYGVPEDLLGRERDTSKANGSSIAFLLELDAHALLLGADAFSPVIEGSLERLMTAREVTSIPVDAFKLPHHGSRSNLSEELLQLAPSDRYLVSTNGDKFKHPDVGAIEMVLSSQMGRDPLLVFNYDGPTTNRWKDSQDQTSRGYRTDYTGRVVLS